jgi:hypothetical protein
MYVCMYVCICVCMYVCMYVYVYMCVCMCVCICVYVYLKEGMSYADFLKAASATVPIHANTNIRTASPRGFNR